MKILDGIFFLVLGFLLALVIFVSKTDDEVIIEQTAIVHAHQDKTDKNSQLIVQTAQGKIDAIVQKREQEAKAAKEAEQIAKEPVSTWDLMKVMFIYIIALSIIVLMFVKIKNMFFENN